MAASKHPLGSSFTEIPSETNVAVAAMLAAAAVLCIAAVTTLFAYRIYRRRVVLSSPFDNPIYKSTTMPIVGAEAPLVRLKQVESKSVSRKESDSLDASLLLPLTETSVQMENGQNI